VSITVSGGLGGFIMPNIFIEEPKVRLHGPQLLSLLMAPFPNRASVTNGLADFSLLYLCYLLTFLASFPATILAYY
jgi:hypothetical protein